MRRQESECDADCQRKRQRVRCAAMTPFVFVSDAKPKADHVGIRKKRERRPCEHRSPRGTLRRAVGPIDTGHGHADREVTKTRHYDTVSDDWPEWPPKNTRRRAN